MFGSTHYRLKKSIITLSLALFVYSNIQSQRPNIIYIMTDDMGYGDLSCYGRKDYTTPNLDKLASQGIKFVNAYSAAPVCNPTRAAFMTGRYPAKTPIGLIEPLTQSKRDSTFGLTAEFPSIATLMSASGYETALIGKWHLGFLPQHSPVKNGFDYFFGIHSAAADYISHKSGLPGNRAHDLYENDTPVYPEGYLTNLFSQKAVAYIKQKHNKPFFLTITYNAVHWPWQGPNDKPYADSVDFRTGGSSAIYAAMMKRLDDGIGVIMKDRNTVIEDSPGKSYSNIVSGSNGINPIFEDKTGKLWFGTNSNTFIYNGKTFTVVSSKEGRTFTNVWSIIEDKRGNIWLGGDGLWRYDGSIFTNFSENNIRYLCEDKKGNIWGSGSVNGRWALYRFDEKSLSNKKPTVIEITESLNLFGIFEANDGNIWFGSFDGVYRYDGKTITDFKDKESQK
ncbi:sulfatase-like hydrolase/transferase [Haliscomenobacter hydrossis]|uniref:N-acetylgalactosamine-6-sulfatase n=1 Tax=Haliscomenobacter hydrossis (strain ATCC 27775 / DSM 1100 / LMG 10767 / O) TaxID=760192 RepID=F4KZE2_HALH1|nr:sulfatase-like hydrolase/transferase [Haliscomenobacter hydrossis]AEE48437.1 N-acetylgalactosamine-6-sulfatase [Haliscomenobacter hydrossis DSM 1100]